MSAATVIAVVVGWVLVVLVLAILVGTAMDRMGE
jgi:hypothetical protein